jgi:hypothetical protein
VEGVAGERVFAAGERDARLGAQVRVARKVVRGNRLLKPADVKLFKTPGKPLRVVKAVAVVRVDHQLDVAAYRLADRRDAL